MFLTTLLLGMDRWCLRLWNCSVPNAHKHWVSFVTGNLPGNFVMNWEIIRLSFKCQKPRAIWINSPEGISSQNGHHSHGFSRMVSRTAGSHQKSPWICTSSLQTGPESWAPGLACVMPLSIYSGRKKEPRRPSQFVHHVSQDCCLISTFHPPQICYAMSMKASNWHIARLYHAAFSEPCITATSQTLLRRLRNSHVIIDVLRI